MCPEEPIHCLQIDEPTVDVIEMYHTAMVEDFRGVLNQHKAVYGWEDEELGFP